MLIEFLVHHFGFHGTILILGGCMLHVCASAALYRPIETYTDIAVPKSMDDVCRHGGSLTSNNLNTNTTYLGSTDEPLNKKYIEHLFLEESKNRLNDFYNTNKFGKC